MVLHLIMKLRDNTQMQSSEKELITSLQSYVDQIPFVRPLTIQVEQASQGSVSLSMKPLKGLLNHFETYQAGSIFTLAEVAGGTLCGTFLDLSKNLLITKKGEIAFLKAASEKLVAEARMDQNLIKRTLSELEKSKKIDAPVSVFINTANGEPIAECHFVYYLRFGIPRTFSSKQSIKTHD